MRSTSTSRTIRGVTPSGAGRSACPSRAARPRPRAGAAGGEPLCTAFNGRTYVVGFSSGLVAAVGHHKWENHRPGAVGVVSAVNSTRLKHTGFVTGGADGTVTFWSEEGAVLSALDLGFQVTALSVHSLYALVGGAAGELDAPLDVLAHVDEADALIGREVPRTRADLDRRRPGLVVEELTQGRVHPRVGDRLAERARDDRRPRTARGSARDAKRIRALIWRIASRRTAAKTTGQRSSASRAT